MINRNLFVEFLRVYTFQPATGFWRAVEVDILKKYLPVKGKCLDLGSGDGKLTSILYEGNVPAELTLIGVDNDPYETKQASTFPFYKQVYTCAASQIPEESNTFDSAFSNSVLEHIQDIGATLAEISRILKPNGIFIFTVPSPGFHECLYGPLNRKASRAEYLKDMDKRLAHYRYWSVEEWQINLTEYGMNVEHTVEYLNCEEVKRWESISRFTAGIIYALGRRKYAPIEAQKKFRLREAQNHITLPRWLAELIAFLLSAGVGKSGDKRKGCLLILARKTSPS